MNLKETFKNKKLVISISTIAAIFIFAIISVVIWSKLSNKASSSSNSADSSLIGDTYSASKNDGAIDIVPMVADSTGVDVNSGFKIVCENKQSKSFFQKALTISPQQDYEIKEVSGKEFLISFNDTLKPNNIYKIGLADKAVDYQYSWAFQTKNVFTLVRTLPRDRSAYVPVDSGIELSFSYEGVENIEQYFEVSPKVNGKFVYNNKTAVFMPEKLEYGTVYTVTVKKGLGLKGSDEVISEDYIFTFETRRSAEQESMEYLSFTNILYNFTPDAAPILDVYASQDFKDQDITVEIYKYSNENDLLDNLKQYDTPAYQAFGRNSDLEFDTSKLQKITEFSTKVLNNSSDYWYGSFIVFPSNLTEGHYLIDIQSKNSTYQTHVQVNDMSVYAMAGTQESLVWVNNSSTGKPIEGAVVSIDGIQSVKTGNDGIAVIQEKVFEDQKAQSAQSNQYNQYYSSNQRQFFKISKNEGSVLLAPLSYYNYQYTGDKGAQKYWAYLYSDRGLYLPTDTVQIWGMARPRIGGDLPSKGTLYLYRSDYAYSYGENSNLSEIISKEIEISELGTFESSMKLSNFNPGSYFIELKLGDETVIQKYFYVRQYTKPAYKIDITPDKKVMFEWEKLNMDIQASFFEGSPVSGLSLNYLHYITWDNRKEGTIVCDENGNAGLEISPTSSSNSWHPLYLNININNAKAEEEDIHAYSNVMVFPRDTMIEVNTSSKNKPGLADNQLGLIEIKTNRINLKKLNNSSIWWYNADLYRGDAVDIPMKIRIYEQHWDREETGEYYDFINKKVQKNYRYFTVKNLLQEFDANTSDGKYTYEFPIQENENYMIEVEGADSRHSSMVETGYLYRYTQPDESYVDSYSISAENDLYSYKLDDTVALTVNKNNLELPAASNSRFLYMILKNGILSYTVKNEPDYSFSFTKDYVPNIYVKAVYFDGKNIFDAKSRPVNYDYKEKDLLIDVKTDKQEYQPGDTVQVEIDVKDAQGNPSSAEVNLSVVDEAFFAVYDQQVDTLASLYKYCFHSGIYSEYLSYKPLNINFGSPEQGGEGGDESARFLFKDNAYFDSIKIDRSGKAKTSFKLPDNLTSWRITYQGVTYEKDTDDIKAGSGKINIPVKLPFFVDVIFNNIFMDGDTVSISARSFGTALQNDAKVEYSIILEKDNSVLTGTENKDDERKTFNSEGKGGNLANIDLGKLEEGDYSVTVKAKHGDYNDSLRRDFKVVKSMLEASRSERYKLTDSLNIAGGKSLTTLSFYNEGASTHYNSLLSLLYSWGERVDQKLSRKIANKLMEKHYGEEMGWAEDSEDYHLNSYQLYDGGIALLPYDSSSPEVTAKISSLSKDLMTSGLALKETLSNNLVSNELFDSTSTKWYFYKILENPKATPEDVAASLWGLASMDEPVLIDIINLLQSDSSGASNNSGNSVNIDNSGNADSIGIKEKLYLGIGLAELGSLKEAQDVYNDIISQYGITNNPYLYIDSKASRDDTIELTALCAVLSVKINAPEKISLFGYVQDNSTGTILTNIERLIYLTHMAPDTSQKGSFAVEVDGKKQNVSLDKNKVFKLVLTPEALQNIKFSNITGDIAVTSSYVGSVKDFIEDTNKLVKINRSYSVDGIPQSSFSQSKLVKITLKPEFSETAPDGYYEITDILPAGLRYVSATNQFDQKWYPGERDGQKVVFGFYYDKVNYDKDSRYRERSITYYARAVTLGQFTADYTFIKHSLSDVSGFADKAQVKIIKGDN